MKSEDVIELYEKYVVPSYRKTDLVFDHADGAYVWDPEGRRYLDFFPGWAVSGLGHCPRAVVEAVGDQAKRLLHVPNNFYHEWQGRLAQRIVETSFPGKVFFCNSGAEAVESAIKLARRFGEGKRTEIICMENAFHGRTLAALSATGQAKYLEGFGPAVPGFRHVPFNRLAAVRRAISRKTAAILLEPIQGEGGIHVAQGEFLRGLRRICDQKNLLLILDEVQTGMGRTGTFFAYQNDGVVPDVMLLAKSLGGGVPIGAMVVGQKAQDLLSPGTHASTFGGNPLVCAAALMVFEAIEAKGLLENVRKMGMILKKRLESLKRTHRMIREVRGRGLMVGVELSRPGKPVVDAARAQGLLINVTQEKVLRVMPPLTVRVEQVEEAMAILERALGTEAGRS